MRLCSVCYFDGRRLTDESDRLRVENARLRAENFKLAAGACPFTDGEGLVADEGGNAYCAKYEEVQHHQQNADNLRQENSDLRAENEKLRAKNEKLEDNAARYQWLITRPGQSALWRFVLESSKTYKSHFAIPERVARAGSVTESIDEAMEEE